MSDQESEQFISKMEEAREIHAARPDIHLEVQVGEHYVEFGERVPLSPDAPTLPTPIRVSSVEEAAVLKRCGFDAVLDNKDSKKVRFDQRGLPSNGTIYEAGQEHPPAKAPENKGRQKRSGNGNGERAPKTHDFSGFTGFWHGKYRDNGVVQKNKGKGNK